MSLKQLDREDRLRLMKFVVSFAWADLRIADQERSFVRRMMGRLKLDKDEAKQVEAWLVLPPRPEEVDPNDVPTLIARRPTVPPPPEPDPEETVPPPPGPK